MLIYLNLERSIRKSLNLNSNKETSHAEWIKGYNEWKKKKFKLKF